MTVILIGAGPGDPQLITQKGIYWLKKADTVLYDHLVHPNLLNFCPENCELFPVGKRKGHHSKTQDEINQLLLTCSQKHQIIVRLKGGDPFIFGRVGEEMAFLTDNKIDFQVVPGVSSAIAVPGFAGIPITHRNLSRSVAFVTGTKQDGNFLDDAQLPEADTLVFLMAITHLNALCEKLIQQNRFSNKTPAALIYKGTTSEQKTVLGTLKTIEKQAKAETISPPALLVVGDVSDCHKKLNWWEKLPLAGQRFIVFRPKNHEQSLAEPLQAMGADVIHIPLMTINPIIPKNWSPNSLEKNTHLIFTSAQGVTHFFKTLLKLEKDSRALSHVQIMAVGPRTGETLRQWGIYPDHIANDPRQEGILEQLPKNLSQAHILLPGASQIRSLLQEEIQKRDGKFTHLPIYESTYTPPPTQAQIHPKDNLILTNPKTITFLKQSPLKTHPTQPLYCMGKTTYEAAKNQLNAHQKIICNEQGDLDGLVALITKHHN